MKISQSTIITNFSVIFIIVINFLATSVFADAGGNLTIPKRDVHGNINLLETDNIISDADEVQPEYNSGSIKIGDDDDKSTFYAQVYSSPNEEEIQFFFNISDPDNKAQDMIMIYFDIDHNHELNEEHDRAIQIVRPPLNSVGSVEIASVGNYGSLVTVKKISTWESQNNTQGWRAEVKIKASDLNLNAIPSLMGIFIEVERNNDNNPNNPNDTFTYPETATANDAKTWANLKTRYPLDYMIVLDQSGSMLSQNKWDNAKVAAQIMASTMKILSPHDKDKNEEYYFNDRIGLVTFSWNCSSSQDKTKTVTLLSSLDHNFETDIANAAAPEYNNCTPIAQGLKEAFKEDNLNATKSDEETQRERAVLLLSDGLHNRPDTLFSSPLETDYDPCGTGWHPCSSSNVQVNTVAFDAGVGFELLSKIKDEYSGKLFPANYNLTDNVVDLKDRFISSLEDFYLANRISSPLKGNICSFGLEPANPKLIIIFSLLTPAAKPQINTNNGTCNETNITGNYASCIINNPSAKESWIATLQDGTANACFVLVDPTVDAKFAMDRVTHGTGNDIILTARLKDRGQPLTNTSDHPVKVTVNIEAPHAGLGTFISTHIISKEKCEEIKPTLPSLPDPQKPTPALALTSLTAVTNSSPDPDPYRFQLMKKLSESCKEKLFLQQKPGVELHDDATMGDKTANDGIYTLRFQNTPVEGTYRFNFKVDGKTTDGYPFTRTKTFAEYVRVEVDPAATRKTFDQRIISQKTLQSNLITKEYSLLPVDKMGGYLGTGHPEEIEFLTTHGQWVGPVIDYLNGYYARRLEYNNTQGEPQVTPVIQGKLIVEKPVAAGSQSQFWWVCVVVIVTLLIIIVWLLLFYESKHKT